MKAGDELIRLFRPVGLAELALMVDVEMRAFPARLPEQPYFYPVISEDYATKIAERWNTDCRQSGHAGYVTKFEIDRGYYEQFPVQTAGGTAHQELWVAAEKLPEFNSHIVGRIETVEAYFGGDFTGFVPEKFGLRGKNAAEQFVCLAETFGYSGMDFICETAANAKSVYLNYPFWVVRDFEPLGVTKAKKQRVLAAIGELWKKRFPLIPLCSPKL